MTSSLHTDLCTYCSSITPLELWLQDYQSFVSLQYGCECGWGEMCHSCPLSLANLKSLHFWGGVHLITNMNTNLLPHSLRHMWLLRFFSFSQKSLMAHWFLFIMLIQLAVKIWHFKCQHSLSFSEHKYSFNSNTPVSSGNVRGYFGLPITIWRKKGINHILDKTITDNHFNK